jgi:hypothetical protein
MLRSETQFHFHLLNKSLAADRERLRPAIVSSRYVSAQSCFDPFTMRLLKFSNIIETAKLSQRQKIDDAIAFRWLLYRQIPAVRPLCGMLYHTGAHHVEVNVHDATM